MAAEFIRRINTDPVVVFLNRVKSVPETVRVELDRLGDRLGRRLLNSESRAKLTEAERPPEPTRAGYLNKNISHILEQDIVDYPRLRGFLFSKTHELIEQVNPFISIFTVGAEAGAGHFAVARDCQITASAITAGDNTEEPQGNDIDFWSIPHRDKGALDTKFVYWLFKKIQANNKLELLGLGIMKVIESMGLIGFWDHRMEDPLVDRFKTEIDLRVERYLKLPPDRPVIIETTHSAAAVLAVEIVNKLREHGRQAFVVERILDPSFCHDNKSCFFFLNTCSRTTKDSRAHFVIVPDHLSARSYEEVYPDRNVFSLGTPPNLFASEGLAVNPFENNLQFQQRENHIAFLFGQNERTEYVNAVCRFLKAEKERIKTGEIVLTLHFFTQGKTFDRIDALLREIGLHEISTSNINYPKENHLDNFGQSPSIRLFLQSEFLDAIDFRRHFLGGSIIGGKPYIIFAPGSEIVIQPHDLVKVIVVPNGSNMHEIRNGQLSEPNTYSLIGQKKKIKPEDWYAEALRIKQANGHKNWQNLGAFAILLPLALLANDDVGKTLKNKFQIRRKNGQDRLLNAWQK